ncbi:MAG TPA: TonB-dependent receptor, partial [Acidobacteriaceae bacterium]
MRISLRTVCGLLLAALLLLAGGTAAHAQFNASLSGTVLDPTQAAIPNATVVLTNDATQVKKTVQSTGDGTFQFTELAPGNYSLDVTAQGFQHNTMSNISVAAESPRNVNVTLQTGQESQTVTVNADTVPVLQTGDASIRGTIDGAEIQRLPTFGADPYEQLRTAPGIVGDAARAGNGNSVFLPNNVGPGGSNSGIYQTENQVQIIASGQRVADNDFMIDGVSVNSLTHGGAAVVTPNEEAVGQITTVATSYDASLGRNSGAQIQVVTKSGTDALHGSVFFLYDEPGFNSFNKYGGPAPGTPTVRNDNKQRTWAASLGGPIFKNKLFFFLSYQGYTQHNPSFENVYTVTPQYTAALKAQRSGGVSETIANDPAATPQIVAVLTPVCTGFPTYIDQNPADSTYGTPVPACQVIPGPSGGLDLGSPLPGGTAQLGVFPTGNAIDTAPYYGASEQQVGGGFDGVPDLQYVQIRVPAQSRGNQYNGRIDWNATSKDLIAGSVYFTKLDNLGTSGTSPAAPQNYVPFKPLNSAETLIWIHTFSPNWLNEARGNGTRFADNQIADGGNTVNYGIPYINIQNYPTALQYGVQAATTTPATFAENTYEFRDTVTRIFGAHSIRVGFEARWEQDNDNLYGYERPTYAFNGLWAFANDASVYEAIYADTNTGGPANTQRYFRSQNYAAFVQHDWKVTPNLTFNAGLRWEEFTPINNKGSQINYPVLGPPGAELLDMKLIPHNHLWNFQHNNWGPKVGLAWTPPAWHNKMVLHAGYALAYNHLDFGLFNQAVEDGPGVANFGLCCGGPGNTAGIIYALGTSHSPNSFPANPNLATGTNANGFPNGVGQVEVYGAPYVLKYPSSDLYSMDIQRDLGFLTSLTIGYNGSSGRHYPRLVDQNFLYNNYPGHTPAIPVFAAYFAQTDSVQNYNALNVNVRRPLHHNIGYVFNYTYGKSLDQVSNGDYSDGSANQTNPANNASEYGPSDYDLRHNIVATVLYQSPAIHSSALMNTLLGGFQANATFSWHTGFPWTPVTGTLNTVPIVDGAAVQNIVRPLAYYG